MIQNRVRFVDAVVPGMFGNVVRKYKQVWVLTLLLPTLAIANTAEQHCMAPQRYGLIN